MEKSHLALVAPTTVNGTVDKAGPPKRRRNAEVRSREYLTDAEVNRLISAAGENRNGHRDATMILVAYRHGLRAGELVTLRWDAVDFAHGRLHVSRLKGSAESVHPLSGRELRALRRLKREQDPAVAIHLHVRTRCTIHDGGIPQDGRPARCGGSTSTFPCIRTCCGMPAVTSSPMTASIPARCRPISATRTSSTRCATPSWRRPASSISGAIDRSASARKRRSVLLPARLAPTCLARMASIRRWPAKLIFQISQGGRT